jgi:ribosomal 50S subunit-associated protein YjgA (DUF615 family)
MSTKTELSRITVNISKVAHKRLKALAAILGISMRELVIESIQARLDRSKIANKETLKAIENIESRKGLVVVESPEDLFKN